MSTTKKGNEFERRVFAALTTELKSEQLGLSPKHARIFAKKAYDSRDRDGRIVTDISIEVSAPDSANPFIFWIFECKDYVTAISVDNLEEFHSKLEQIGADNTKGTIVIRGALQRSALNFAKSKKIGVIRLLPSDQMVHLARFLTIADIADLAKAIRTDWSEFPSALLNPGHRSERGFFASDNGYYMDSWVAVLKHGLSEVLERIKTRE